ncbi:MAG: pentapeptide repeat-containing protein, partial [Mycobacteriales bacterium]
MDTEQAGADAGRLDLVGDCGNCFGLCCVALPFAASADFAITKPASVPCPNLRTDFRCGIHRTLTQQGFRGCAAYDCFGAGQQVSQVTFSGHDWRTDPGTAQRMYDAFATMRLLHELLWYLTEALALDAARALHEEIAAALAATRRLTAQPADVLSHLDVEAHRAGIATVLRRVSEIVRADAPAAGIDYRGADLGGARLAR